MRIDGYVLLKGSDPSVNCDDGVTLMCRVAGFVEHRV